MLLVFDGPEKAGKSTLIKELGETLSAQNNNVTVRHWGKVSSDTEYAAPLIADLKKASELNEIIVWDRSWASEKVYGFMLNRHDHRLTHLQSLGEWYYSRMVDHYGGMRFIVLPDIQKSASLRSADDLPVDPYNEYEMFRQHALAHDWFPLTNKFTQKDLDNNVDIIVKKVEDYKMPSLYDFYAHAEYYGNISGKCVFYDDYHSMNEGELLLPFSHIDGWKFASHLPRKAYNYGWLSPHHINDYRQLNTVIAFGDSYKLAKEVLNFGELIEAPALADFSDHSGLINQKKFDNFIMDIGLI